MKRHLWLLETLEKRTSQDKCYTILLRHNDNVAVTPFIIPAKTKIEGCITLKRFIEQDKLKVYSKAFLRELKCFVAKGSSFGAQSGETDDLVMSMLIAVRMITYIASFEDAVYEAVNQNIKGIEEKGYADDDDETHPYDEYDEPMPIGLL